MLMFAAALLVQAVLSAAPAAKTPATKPAAIRTAQPVGPCAWSKLGAAEQKTVLDAYHQGRSEGLQTLMAMDGPVAAAIDACAPKSRMPDVYLHRALWAEMTQVGAVQELARSGVDRPALDAAWAKASAAAKLCLHNRLGPNFGMLTPACDDPVETTIAESLKLPASEAAIQASIYYLAKAEGEWAESLIADSPFK